QATRIGRRVGIGLDREHVPGLALAELERRRGLDEVVDAGAAAADRLLGRLGELETGHGRERSTGFFSDALGGGEVARVLASAAAPRGARPPPARRRRRCPRRTGRAERSPRAGRRACAACPGPASPPAEPRAGARAARAPRKASAQRGAGVAVRAARAAAPRAS